MTCRLYPTCAQAARLEHYLFIGRILYNRALEARIHWYGKSGKSLTFYDQCADLTELRAADLFWRDVPVEIQRDGLRRLDKAFKSFFRRVKAGQKPGFPRFKGCNRWESFTIHKCGNVIKTCRIRIRGVDGAIRARNVRYLDGRIIEQRIVRKAGKWFCQLVIDTPAMTSDHMPRPAVGIDVGLSRFATMSDGCAIENPRFGKKAQRKLAHAHRNVSRTKKGSKNRRKMIDRLQRVYLRIHNLRHNFTHQESRRIANKYGVIAVEDLNINAMVRSRFGKSILDACWRMFISQLTYKAEEAGGMLVRVNPTGTSQECSQCGQTVQKDLSVRIHRCDCGCVLDRDLNAARNILRRALNQHRPTVGGIVMPVEGTVASSAKQETLIFN